MKLERGPTSTQGVRLVACPYRPRAGSREVVGERVGARRRAAASAEPAAATARRHADEKAARVEVRTAAALRPLPAPPPRRMLQPSRRRPAMVVSLLLRRLLPRARRHAPATVVRCQGGAGASPEGTGARPRPSPPLRRLRRGRSGRSGVRPPWREDREHLCAAIPDGDAQGRRGRDRTLRGRMHQLSPPPDGDAGRVAPRLGARSRDSAVLVLDRRAKPRACLRRLAVQCVRRLRRDRSSGPRVRSRRSQARLRHAFGVVRLQPWHHRRRDRQVRRPLRELPPARDRKARRSFPLQRPKLCGAPVAQLVRAGDF
jgi:hypothetical protein